MLVLAQLQEDRMWASWMDIAFAKLDANGDGYISLEELLSRLPDPALSSTDQSAGEGDRLNEVRRHQTLVLTLDHGPQNQVT